MGSQLVAVRKALVDGLAALSAYTTPTATGQTPEIAFGWKVGWKRRERVWTQNARFSHEPASMRAVKTFTNEVGQFDLLIFVHGVGLSQETTSIRVNALGVAAWDYIQTHANWAAIPGLTEMLVIGDGALAEAVDDKGNALAELTLPIRYRARLT